MNNHSSNTEAAAVTAPQHTPGPWAFDASTWSIHAARSANKDSNLMGDYRGPLIADFTDSVGHGPNGQSRRFAIPEMQANALLIAAAPEMLEQLTEARKDMAILREALGFIVGADDKEMHQVALVRTLLDFRMFGINRVTAKAEGRQ